MNSRGNTTHGATGTLTHKRWRAMRARCLNPRAHNYPQYGGAGVTICEHWSDFSNFLADMGPCPAPEMTIERERNDRGYEPGNCSWATRAEQNRNTGRNRFLTFDGQTLCVAAWAEKTGLKAQTILNRLRYGWPLDRVFGELGDARGTRQPRSKP